MQFESWRIDPIQIGEFPNGTWIEAYHGRVGTMDIAERRLPRRQHGFGKHPAIERGQGG